MCGLAGFVDYSRSQAIEGLQATVTRMADALRHRGVLVALALPALNNRHDDRPDPGALKPQHPGLLLNNSSTSSPKNQHHNSKSSSFSP